jgi:hypothetical protein
MDLDTDENVLYIKLLEEGTDVYRITKGIKVKNLTFKVLSTNKYDPSDEIWEFPPGKVVKCRETFRDGKIVYIAYKECKISDSETDL